MPDLFHWARKVSRRDIQRLYASDASGMLDEDLLNQILYGIYARITDMLELQEAQKKGIVHCRSCGSVTPDRFRMGYRHKSDLLICQKCGWQVTCGEFFESYSGERMLPGSRPDVFNGFMERFPKAKTAPEKMLLVDWLIHEFHVLEGIDNRLVATNVIQGSKQQVSELIAALACGPNSTPGIPQTKEEWQARFAHPYRVFRQSHAEAQVLQIAADLGIVNHREMQQDQLVAEIYRLMPQLFF